MNIVHKEGGNKFKFIASGLFTNDKFESTNLDDGLRAVLDGAGGTFEKSRNAQSDAVDRVRLTYVEAENDFGTLAAEAVYPGDQTSTTIEAEASIQLTEPEANAVVERWLAETVAESERIRFAVAKSKIRICAGDLVTIAGDFYRVERIEDAAALVCDAVRVDMGAYSVFGERGAMAVRSASISPTPVFSVFMDLPILRGDEDPYAPHVAVAASPWPGPIAVWSSATDTGYQLNVQAESPAIVGTTLSALERAPSGLWDNGSVLIVDVSLGGISAASRFEVLNGANLAVIGDQSAEGWEVFQFSDAVLTGTDTYQLRGLLRGLAGSDATMPSVWPSGSLVVLLDGLVPQIQLPSASRGLGRYYRLGLSENGYTGANVVTRIETFNSIGLRPYSVAHLNYRWDSFGNLLASWIRRTRIDGDNWSSVEVPLGEASETYTVIVSKNDNIVRQVIVTDPSWTFTATMQAENAISAPFEVRVAQNSSSFGAGPFRSVTVL